VPNVKRDRPGVGSRVDAAPDGRAAQRRRTRKAIVDATAGLIAQGVTPTVADVAAAADVSRRTVYMYFPSLEHLLLDATLGALSQADVDGMLADPRLGDDPHVRVEALARALQTMSPEAEALGRSLIRLTVERSDGTRSEGAPPRGYRRVEWVEAALEPVRAQLDAERFSRLVSALTMVVGWEALIVQRDVRGLSIEQGADLSVWMARALVDAALAEQSATPS
jgi:AcrR family transcriptional regulator